MYYYVFGLSETSRVMFQNLKQDGLLEDFKGFTVDPEHSKTPDWFNTIDEKYRIIVPFNKESLNPHDLIRGIYLPIYDNKLRETKFDESLEMGLTPLSFVDSRAFVDLDAKIGRGCWVQMGACIQSGCTLEDGVIVWGLGWCGHNSTIKSFSFVSSGSVVCGNVKVGSNCYLGVNSAVKESTDVCDETILGMGALLVKPNKNKGDVFLAGANNLRKNEKTN